MFSVSFEIFQHFKFCFVFSNPRSSQVENSNQRQKIKLKFMWVTVYVIKFGHASLQLWVVSWEYCLEPLFCQVSLLRFRSSKYRPSCELTAIIWAPGFISSNTRSHQCINSDRVSVLMMFTPFEIDKRMFHFNVIFSRRTRSSHWFPPPEFWVSKLGLPYGWEAALDSQNKQYYIK